MEELKLILEAISQLGESGKEAFIYWLIADKGVPVILTVLWLGALVAIVKVGLRCIHEMQETAQLIKEIGEDLLPHYRGYLTATRLYEIRAAFKTLLQKEK